MVNRLDAKCTLDQEFVVGQAGSLEDQVRIKRLTAVKEAADFLEIRTPKWANIRKMQDVYERAFRLRKAGYAVEVDHIIPLRGKDVCGLHCEHNLRIIDKQLNQEKLNNPDFFHLELFLYEDCAYTRWRQEYLDEPNRLDI